MNDKLFDYLVSNDKLDEFFGKEDKEIAPLDYEKYAIKKDKLDLMPSLKALDKKLLKEKFNEFGVDDINELKEYILDSFEFSLEFARDDVFSRIYFERLLKNENSMFMSAYQQDINDLMVFIYKNGDYYSYYIPIEIKKLIKKILNI